MKKYFMLLVPFLLAACGEQIDTGNRGVRTWWGEVTSVQPLTEGLYFYVPVAGDIVEYNCKTKRFDVNLATYTKDIQPASIRISINYYLKPEKVIEVHKRAGLSYQSTLLEPKVIGSIKDVAGKWDASSLVANRDIAAKQILEMIQDKSDDNYFKIVSVNIDNIDYSDAFEAAIERKVIATQDAEAAKNRTEQVKEEANQKVLAAEAEARSIQIRSEALSKNQSLVAYEAVQKWDGRLPVSMYGSAPIPFLNAK